MGDKGSEWSTNTIILVEMSVNDGKAGSKSNMKKEKL